MELAVVIGRTLCVVPREDQICRNIAGYTILHDVSARDVQFKDNQITLGGNLRHLCADGSLHRDSR